MADKEKKQVPLRLSKSLYDELARWAEDDFRSLNGQIEYLLTECVKKRKKNSVRRESEDVPDSFERDKR
ncbi:MAG: PTS ascorbate transporter subunit IIC [Clostridia bacterium]|nr:PTS ascorbate transporter subunit IIC [Clostridia bacterium]